MTPAEAAEAVKVQVQTDKERIEQQVIARYPRASNALTIQKKQRLKQQKTYKVRLQISPVALDIPKAGHPAG